MASSLDGDLNVKKERDRKVLTELSPARNCFRTNYLESPNGKSLLLKKTLLRIIEF